MESPKDRLEAVSREPTCEKKIPRIKNGFKRGSFDKEGPKDRLEMVSKEPTPAKEGLTDKLEVVLRRQS